ncbi:MAG TPA: TrbC/VirB2 family protein [Longimicrobium sp.]|jgi:type IV secretion system protein VirB2
MHNKRRETALLLGLLALSFVFVPDLWAGGTGSSMPWNTPMQTFLNNLTGPTARTVVGIGTAIAGYQWIFGGHEQGTKWLSRCVVGGAVALTAQTIVSYASFGGALL